MSECYDTYFINARRAFKIAKQNNQVSLYNGYGTQICYYYGTKLQKDLPNLIHLPIDTIKHFFQNNNLRKPEYIDFIDSEYTDQDNLQEKVKDIMAKIFEELNHEEEKINTQLLEKLQRLKKIPIKEKLTFIIIVSRTLHENYTFARKLLKSIKSFNHKAVLLTEEGNRKSLIYHIQTKHVYEKIVEIKPNSIILINDLKTNFLPDSISQISIVKGFISILNKITEKDIRKNDIILTSNFFVQKKLLKNNIKSRYIPPINQNKITIKQKTEHLLIHESYFDLSQEYLVLKPMIKRLETYAKKNTLTIKYIQKEMKKTAYPNTDDYELMVFIYSQLLTQITLKNIDSKNLNIKLLGYNWEKYEHCQIKQINPTSSKIKDMYQTSKYILHISHSIIDNRLLKILASGAIPVIYDNRYQDNYYNKTFDNYCLFFKTEQELNEILNKKLIPKKININRLLSYYNFNSLAMDICNSIHDRNKN